LVKAGDERAIEFFALVFLHCVHDSTATGAAATNERCHALNGVAHLR
jgi:hypothetical protein